MMMENDARWWRTIAVWLLVAGAVSNTASYTLPRGITLTDGATFEYVVVGAGAAGCAAAARLALAGADVLLVEAGGDPSPLSEIPAAAMALLGSSLDWQYPTLPNNVSCLASRGRQCRYSRGRCLGGSSAINYMIYTRGNRRDFDYNITGWNWADLEPYFLRHEGLQVLDKFPRSSIPYHNTTGNVKIEFFDNPQNPWHRRLIDGYRALNFPYNGDVNGVSQIGVSQVVGYVYEGKRMSVARTYLTRNDVKRTLKVAKYALCTGVIIDDDNVARGITVITGSSNITLRLFARKEVILSAGTVGTPQILMLSGIGPAQHLNSMGIKVRADLPVGDNMSDHVLPLVLLKVDRNRTGVDSLLSLAENIGQVGEYIFQHTGSLASNGLTDVNAFANSGCYKEKIGQLQNQTVACELPTLQTIHAYIDKNLIPLVKPLFQNAVGLNDDVVNQLAAINVDYAFIVCSLVVLQPFSRGTIRLATSDPRDYPSIFANYLDDSRDVDEMLRSIEIIERLVETPPMKRNGASVVHVLRFPGCGEWGRDRRARRRYWRCYVRHMTYAVYHAVGTSSLGRVVDARLRVRNVRRLRVADLSVVPRIPRGNTEAVALAIGERIVDFIRDEITH